MSRSENIQTFLTKLEGAFEVAENIPETRQFLDRLNAALVKPYPPGSEQGYRLPVCEHLSAALGHARLHSTQLSNLAAAFSSIEPSLRWKVRASSNPSASENWTTGHANAIIVGPDGLENRDDVTVGVSLLAPHVRYPDHHHAPEEIYLVLTPGRFQHGKSEWIEPGVGGTLHNEPFIMHAMASGHAPLLAFWCLIN
jgi:hypothetical protein